MTHDLEYGRIMENANQTSTMKGMNGMNEDLYHRKTIGKP